MQAHEETLREIVLQEMNEEHYNRKHIDAKIRKAIEESPAMQAKLAHGIQLIEAYIAKAPTYYKSKAQRVAQLQSMEIGTLVMEMFVGVAYSLRPELFTSVTAQMAARLNFSDRTEAITTVAELLAVLCETDAFDINKEHKMASLMLVSRVPLPENLIRFIENSQCLPPMVCEPLELKHNHSSGYLTHNDSLILGSGNHHDGDICLDVLNTINKVAFKLDLAFLSTVEEEPTFEIDNQEKADAWARFKQQSYWFYSLMAQQGNRFYFCNKVDKRGRIYAQGYHLNPQGAAFKKAMLELANEEVVTGGAVLKSEASPPPPPPQYRWLESGHLQVLEQCPDTWLSAPTRGTYVVVWHSYDQKWEMGLSSGTRVDRIWDPAHLPKEFRLALLLLGVTP